MIDKKKNNNDRQAKQERFKDRITILIERERILDRITNYPQTDKQIKHKQTKQPLTNQVERQIRQIRQSEWQ